MGETRVDLLHLLEDLRDAYPESIEESFITEAVANALDSGATTIALSPDVSAAGRWPATVSSRRWTSYCRAVEPASRARLPGDRTCHTDGGGSPSSA